MVCGFSQVFEFSKKFSWFGHVKKDTPPTVKWALQRNGMLSGKHSSFVAKNKHSASFSSERVRTSCSPSFEMSINKQENSQSIQTLLSGKQPLNSPSHSKREPSAYSFRTFDYFKCREKISTLGFGKIIAGRVEPLQSCNQPWPESVSIRFCGNKCFPCSYRLWKNLFSSLFLYWRQENRWGA